MSKETLTNDLSIITTALYNATMNAEQAAARLVDRVKDLIGENQRLQEENEALSAGLEKLKAYVSDTMPKMIQTSKEHAALLAFMNVIFGKDSAELLELGARRYVAERDAE